MYLEELRKTAEGVAQNNWCLGCHLKLELLGIKQESGPLKCDV
jgi:hypothetical protein